MDLIKFIIKLFSSPLGISFLAILACCCYYSLERLKKSYKPIVQIVLFFILIFVLYRFYSTVNSRINNFFVWDFTAWFLWGKVAAQGLNFYLPESSQIVYNTLNLPAANFEEFVDAIVNVGFLYPPPTMLYFIALGFMPFDLALKLWTSFILIFLFACIYLIYIEFFRKDRLNGFMLVSILVLIFPMVNFTIVCSQTNFILLFYLLLIRKYADHKFAGVLLALAFFTKPFMLIFGFYFLLSKNRKAIAYFIASALVISGITAFIFGIDTFMSYFFNNATQRLPAWTFSEDVNQSLNAILLRANLISLDKPYVYLIIASVVFGATLIYLFYLQKRKQSDFIWAILLLVGLLIYPGTLNYYAVVLLFITFQFFDTEKPLGLNLYLLIPVIGIFYYLNSFSVFASICFLLVIVVLKSLWQLKQNNVSIGLNSVQ
jgi:hypothetical protein